MISFATEKIKVTRIRVSLSLDVQKYAMDYLAIANNVRDNRELLAFGNYPNSEDAYVICEESATKATVDWLGWYGNVTETETLTGIKPVLEEERLTPTEWGAEAHITLPAESLWN